MYLGVGPLPLRSGTHMYLRGGETLHVRLIPSAWETSALSIRMYGSTFGTGKLRTFRCLYYAVLRIDGLCNVSPTNLLVNTSFEFMIVKLYIFVAKHNFISLTLRIVV